MTFFSFQDKWRNMSVSANGQGPREKSRTPKPKATTDSPATAIPLAITWTPGSSAAAVVDPASTDVQMDDSSKCLLDGKTASKYAAFFMLVSTVYTYIY